MIVKHVLRSDQERAGFTVEEPNDHIVELRRHGEVVARYTPNVTIYRLRRQADLILWLELSKGAMGARVS